MLETTISPSRVLDRGYGRRRFLLASTIGMLVTVALMVVPALARADTSSTLTVVGTSDVSDSGLIANVIQPDFNRAYPQFTFKYIGTATGMAITSAETGAQGASALIVHAASLENQFVAGGFSYERFGRAIFTNDFVLAGSTPDPAGVLAGAPNNIAQAFANIATAGINGGGTPRATFVSRGGTPGTTVEEHKIWALVAALPSPPAGLLLCAVSAANGGGDTPIAAGNGVTASGQPCPSGGALPTGAQLPPWYVTTGLTQGPNVIAANACNGYPSGPNSCYVLTDRGTFDYLASGTDPAGTIPSLKVVTRGPQPASAPGGMYALINYFHAYIINPSKPNETVNLTAAKDFLNLLTSPSVQAQLKSYLANTPGGAPFVADASPIITARGFTRRYHAGRPLTITGTVTNAEPGFPALAGKTVTIDKAVAGVPVPVARGTTNASGKYRIRFSPTSTGRYEVATGLISQIEIPTLTPPFGDLLSPGATASVTVKVQSAIRGLRIRLSNGVVLATGSVAPGRGHLKATVAVLVRPLGSRARFRRVATQRLRANRSRFSVKVVLPAGAWQIEVRFQDPRQVLPVTSRPVTLVIP